MSLYCGDAPACRPCVTNSLKTYIFIFQDFDVREFVQANPSGYLIEKEFMKNGTLTSETREMLIRIVVAHLVKKFT